MQRENRSSRSIIERRTDSKCQYLPAIPPIERDEEQPCLNDSSCEIWAPPTPPFLDRFRPQYVSTPPITDKKIGSCNVFELTPQTYDSFLQDKEMTLVMFYTQREMKSRKAMKELKKAADYSRPHYTFASVNCQKQPMFCRDEGIGNGPYFRIYKGKNLITQVSGAGTTADDINGLIESYDHR